MDVASYWFKKMCVDVAKRLSEEDAHTLSFIYNVDIPNNCTCTLSKVYHVFRLLEKADLLRPDNTAFLLKLLEDLNRHDLQNYCETYIQESWQQTATGIYPATALPRKHSKNATTSTKNTKQASILYYFKSKSNKTDVCQLKSPLLCGKPLYGLSEDHLIERDRLFMQFTILSGKSEGKGAACIVNSLGVGYDHVPDVFSQNENLQDHTSEKYPFGWQRVFWSTRYTLIPPPHTVVIDAVTDAVLKIKHSGAMSAVHNTLFSTSFPSPDSIRLLPCAGIREVVYGGEKSIELPAMLQQCGINFRFYKE